MPRTQNPRTAAEVAAAESQTVDDFRQSAAYRKGVDDGTIIDPRKTGPNVDAGLEEGDVTADPTISSVAGAAYNPGVNTTAMPSPDAASAASSKKAAK